MAARSSGRLESSSRTIVPGSRIIHDLVERRLAAAEVHGRAVDDDEVGRALGRELVGLDQVRAAQLAAELADDQRGEVERDVAPSPASRRDSSPSCTAGRDRPTRSRSLGQRRWPRARSRVDRPEPISSTCRGRRARAAAVTNRSASGASVQPSAVGGGTIQERSTPAASRSRRSTSIGVGFSARSSAVMSPRGGEFTRSAVAGVRPCSCVSVR